MESLASGHRALVQRPQDNHCGSWSHFNRRTLLRATGLSAASWLTRLSTLLARQQEAAPRGKPAQSVILLWLQGGPSQLETFDPHPGTAISAGTRAIKTAVPGVQLGAGFQQLAAEMDSIALVRSLTSKEGDHERATYNAKTGFRPDPTLVHPSIGAVVCHQLTDDLEIPRHVSILPGEWPARGGYLGDRFDAFQTWDPRGSIPDVKAQVSEARLERRVDDLFNVVEREFSRGRLRDLDTRKTLHDAATRAALRMMSSDQLQAFDVNQASEAEQRQFGDTPFGRGCLAAARLVAADVRCVEVTLSGWDSHVNNHETQAERISVLDPAFAALIRWLKQRELFDSTVIICGGEFGRTPRINPAGGRDHWPHGFSVALAGGGIRGGAVYGETSPEPKLDEQKRLQDVQQPRNIADLHATVLSALGIDFSRELDTPVGRPMVISNGQPIRELLES